MTEAATLNSVQVWMNPVDPAGSLAIRIRSANPQKNGLPGQTTAPFLGATSIYEKIYPLGNTGGGAGWATFANYNAILAAGTYWLSLEPVSASGFNASLPGGAANPLARYAYYGNGNPGYLELLPNPGIGIRISGTPFPGYAFGTATRTILTLNPTIDQIFGGNGQALTYHWIIDLNGAGWSFGLGRLNDNRTQYDLNGLSAGAYTATCWSLYSSACSQAAGRGVAYRTFINAGSVAKTFRINALLEGAFFGTGPVRALAAIYAFDTAGFTNTLNAHPNVTQYLLGRDGLGEIGAVFPSISLASLFPGSVLTTASAAPVFPLQQVQTVPLTTGFITLNPQETFTLMFDVAAYSSNGGSTNFADTLAPAAAFFTDPADNPVPEILAVGPSSLPPLPASLTLTPASTSNPVGTTANFVATVKDAHNQPVANATVFFTIASGPNTGGPPLPLVTDANGQATFAYSSSAAGNDSIQASIHSLTSNLVTSSWTIPGPLDHITISPATATIPAGGSQSYTAEGFDKFGNSRGDVTNGTLFTISPDGSCTGASCTANVPGAHTVTGTNNSLSAGALLTVSNAQPTPPQVTCSVNPSTLWPANSKPVSVTVTGVVTPGSSPLSNGGAGYAVTDEYGEVQPSGPISVSGNSYSVSFPLIASRLGSDKDGRLYSIKVSVLDQGGNSGVCTTTVRVPHDQGK